MKLSLKARKKKSKAIDLGRLVPLVDVSGSMSGTPMDVAVALGILVSELSADEFKNRFITFHEQPSWHKLNSTDTISEKVKSTMSAKWGYNTNFDAALDMILRVCVDKKLQPEEIPDLIVFSDMQFDAAIRRPSVQKVPWNWDTAHQKLVKDFQEAGIKAVGKPYEVPTIIYWNLRGDTNGHAVQANQVGTRLLSGFSPSLLKLLLSGDLPEEEEIMEVDAETGEVKKVTIKPTPYDTLRAAIDDTAYDAVREVLSKSKEGALAGYTFKPAST